MPKLWCDWERIRFERSRFVPYRGVLLFHKGVQPPHSTNGLIVPIRAEAEGPGSVPYGEGPLADEAVPDDAAAARDAVQDALARLPGWEVSQPVYRDDERLWYASAHGTRRPSRFQPLPYLEGTGATEVLALRQLAEELRIILDEPERPQDVAYGGGPQRRA